MKATNFILEYWAQWVFALMGAGILAAIPKIKALWNAVLALLHDRIYTECYRFLELGHITRDGLRNLTYLYKTYHTMGGNGTGTELYNGTAHPGRLRKSKWRYSMNKLKDISLATIVRTLCLAFALFNQVLSACGHPMIPLDNAQMEQFLTSVITVIAALVSWWKNNSFTKEAIEADKVYNKLVASRKRGD